MKTTKYIIWDWNGTLLDDVDICISCMNEMLRKRDIKSHKVYEDENVYTFLDIVPRKAGDGQNIKWKTHPEYRGQFDEMIKKLIYGQQ